MTTVLATSLPFDLTAGTAPTAVDDNVGNLGYNIGDVFVDVLANDTYTGTPVLSILSLDPHGPRRLRGHWRITRHPDPDRNDRSQVGHISAD